MKRILSLVILLLVPGSLLSMDKINVENISAQEQEELNDKLLNAAHKGSADQIAELLAQGADVNAQDCWGKNALYYAVNGAYFDTSFKEALCTLVDAGADISIKDKEGYTALTWALFLGLDDCVCILLDGGADVNTYVKEGDTLLMKAAENGKDNMVRQLLSAGADVDFKDKHNKTALFSAAIAGKKKCVQRLLAAGAHVNVQDNYEFSPVTLAARWGYQGSSSFESGIPPAMVEARNITAVIIHIMSSSICWYPNAQEAKEARETVKTVLLILNREHNEKIKEGSFSALNDKHVQAQIFLSNKELAQNIVIIWLDKLRKNDKDSLSAPVLSLAKGYVVDYVLEKIRNEFSKIGSDDEVSLNIRSQCDPADVEQKFKKALEEDMVVRLSLLKSSPMDFKEVGTVNNLNEDL